jgi:hypothetical protein
LTQADVSARRSQSDGCQAFAARATAAGDGGRATLGFIAGEESVLTFAADFRRLILAFHKLNSVCSAKKRVCEDSNEPFCVKARF